MTEIDMKATVTVPTDVAVSVLRTVLVACAGLFVAFAPVTMVSVSLSSIALSTGADTAGLQWVISMLVIPMAALILSFGVLGDLFGRRRVFQSGLVFCAVGGTTSFGAGWLDGSASLHLLWVGQLIAGIGAAAIIPSSLALISAAETDFRKRSRWIGLWAATMVISLAAGGFIGGVVLEFAAWQWIFVVIIPLALIVVAVAQWAMGESSAAHGRRADLPGQLLAIVAIVGIVDGVIEGGSAGFGSAHSWVAVIIGLVALGGFIAVELQSDSPMLDMKLFGNPVFAVAAGAAAVAMFAYLGLVFLLSIFLGGAQHLDALTMAERLVFLFLACAAGSQLAGLLIHRLGTGAVLVTGLLVLALGFVALSGMELHSSLLDVGWRLAVAGFGMGIVLPTVTSAAVNAVPLHQAGMASAGINAIRQFGGAMGPAVFGVLLVSWSNDAATENISRIANVEDRRQGAESLAQYGVQRGGAVAQAAAPGSPLTEAFGMAQTTALHNTALVGASIALLVAVVCGAVFVRLAVSAKKVPAVR
jgi:EmrB/QacA subfamily drug resistance transporter